MRLLFISENPINFYNQKAPTALPYRYMRYRPRGLEVLAASYPPFVSMPWDQVVEDYRKIGIEDPYPLGSPKTKDYPFAVNLIRSLTERSRDYLGRKFFKEARTSQQIRRMKTKPFPIDKRFMRKVEQFRPDVVYLYANKLISWAERLADCPIVVSGPDSFTLHFERAMHDGSWSYDALPSLAQQCYVNSLLESAWTRTGAIMHLVGLDDLTHYRALGSDPSETAKRSFFSVHPRTIELPRAADRLLEDRKPWRIFLSLNEHFYQGGHSTRIIDELAQAPAEWMTAFRFVLLGDLASQYAEPLSRMGYVVEAHSWVENYQEFLLSMDIGLAPIDVGTGTKGKVLAMMEAGMLCIGSAYAFENIQSEPDQGYVLYEQPEQVIQILRSVLREPRRYREIALRGREDVLAYHDPHKTSEDFWRGAFDRLGLDCAAVKDHYCG